MERNLQEEICGYYNSINHVQNQMQMQLDKQTLIQFQDLANCIRILGTALSLAENYAIMNGYNTKSKEFTHYDYYNASQNTEKNLYFKNILRYD
jgi:tRNA A37 threonylcarbamoyladenosine biosynthesis protein TsaE